MALTRMAQEPWETHAIHALEMRVLASARISPLSFTLDAFSKPVRPQNARASSSSCLMRSVETFAQRVRTLGTFGGASAKVLCFGGL